MSAVEVTITGMLYDRVNRTSQNVVLIGEANLTNLGVGGGPVIPPGMPPGIWGPTDPRPTPPIYLPPGGSGGPPVDPPAGGGDKPPPDDGGWGFVAEWSRWGYFPGSGQGGPK